MYKDHPNFPSPSDDTVLWRYMDFTKFVSLLERKALFFCRADLLGDPFEGSISPVTPPALPADFKPGPIKVHQFDLREVVRLASVSCWHAAEFESEAMWRLYARERDGIAIKTLFSSFKDAILGGEDVFAAPVQYRDYRTDRIPFGNAIAPLFHKRMSFKHEQEVRAIIFGKSEGAGCYCNVDLAKLVQDVVVAPFAEDWFYDLVCSLAERYDLKGRVRQSMLSENPHFTAQLVVPKE